MAPVEIEAAIHPYLKVHDYQEARRYIVDLGGELTPTQRNKWLIKIRTAQKNYEQPFWPYTEQVHVEAVDHEPCDWGGGGI